jgi:hypothetical protein
VEVLQSGAQHLGSFKAKKLNDDEVFEKFSGEKLDDSLRSGKAR